MKVKIINAQNSYYPTKGQIIDIAEAEAKNLIAGKIAEAVDEKTKTKPTK